MATGTTTDQKTTALRIQRALAKPGAVGMKGFLLWTEAAWPPAISGPILAAASKYTPGAGPNSRVATVASPANGGFSGFGLLGDDSSFTVDLTSVPDSVSSAISSANDPTQAPVSPTTAATASQPASSSWLSDIGTAVAGATQAALAVVQVQDAQKIFDTNLTRAQKGLAPIATNPSQYGLPSATANIGLTSSATNTVLMVAAILGGGLLLASLAGKRGK